MHVLVHLGLNKCGSTFLQHALDAARLRLCAAGIWYPSQAGPPCQYGLSRYYGFGPDAPGIAQQTVATLVASARAASCGRLILSSEYLSLYRPAAAERLVADLTRAGCRAEFLFFSRPIVDWVRSLFNQYVRTVEGGRYLPGIDAFVDQVLENRAIDVARRYHQWDRLAAPGALRHLRISPGEDAMALLTPVSVFCSLDIAPPPDLPRNASVCTDSLFRIGQLRQEAPNRARNLELEALLNGGPPPGRAPADYLRISPAQHDRLVREIVEPYERLPRSLLRGATSVH